MAEKKRQNMFTMFDSFFTSLYSDDEASFWDKKTNEDKISKKDILHQDLGENQDLCINTLSKEEIIELKNNISIKTPAVSTESSFSSFFTHLDIPGISEDDYIEVRDFPKSVEIFAASKTQGIGYVHIFEKPQRFNHVRPRIKLSTNKLSLIWEDQGRFKQTSQ